MQVHVKDADGQKSYHVPALVRLPIIARSKTSDRLNGLFLDLMILGSISELAGHLSDASLSKSLRDCVQGATATLQTRAGSDVQIHSSPVE